MSGSGNGKTISIEGRKIGLSNLDKILFPEAGITKGELIEYYGRVAETMLPYLKDRPISMERYPDGIDREGFYQKELPEHFPDWIDRIEVDVKEGGSQYQVACNDRATLVYLADQACLTPHVWLSRAESLNTPDRLIFDLDPPGSDFQPVREAARRLREMLEALGLFPLPMLTGSSGVHVTVPLQPEAQFDAVREFAQDVAAMLARGYPEQLTVARSKQRRRGRVFIDTARNAYAQTAVPPYAVRSRAGATVAVPIEWDELSSSDLRSDSYTVKNLFRRLAQKQDPWKGMHGQGVRLSEAMDRLDEAAGLKDLES
jgi:bifunctional non-homologous end joining protein LigD